MLYIHQIWVFGQLELQFIEPVRQQSVANVGCFQAFKGKRRVQTFLFKEVKSIFSPCQSERESFSATGVCRRLSCESLLSLFTTEPGDRLSIGP